MFSFPLAEHHVMICSAQIIFRSFFSLFFSIFFFSKKSANLSNLHLDVNQNSRNQLYIIPLIKFALLTQTDSSVAVSISALSYSHNHLPRLKGQQVDGLHEEIVGVENGY